VSTIHLRLAILRTERQLSQRKLAEVARLCPDTISALERGETSDIQFETLARLCETLECEPGGSPQA
jgi:putative transcriptional regulator